VAGLLVLLTQSKKKTSNTGAESKIAAPGLLFVMHAAIDLSLRLKRLKWNKG